MLLLLQKVLGIEVLQDNWRRTARCSGKTLMRGMYTIQKTRFYQHKSLELLVVLERRGEEKRGKGSRMKGKLR